MDEQELSVDDAVAAMRRQALISHSSFHGRATLDRAVATPEKGRGARRPSIQNVTANASAAAKETLTAAASWMGAMGKQLLGSTSSSSSQSNPLASQQQQQQQQQAKTKAGGADPDDLDSIVDATDACASLRRAVEVKREPQAIATLDIVSDLVEKHGSSMILALGAGGAYTYIDQLLSWRNTSTPICESSLRAICSLVSEEKIRRKIVSGGACYRIVKAMQLQIHDEIVLEWGLRVLRYLALDEGSLSKLAQCGACEIVATALNTYNQNDSIVEWSCRIIYALTQDEENASQDKFAAALVPEAIIVGVLQERQQSEDLPMETAIWCLRAIGGLARRHARNKEKLANLGACELIQQLLQRFGHQDSVFAEGYCWAVGNLAFPDETTQSRLAAAGACVSVIQALEFHIAIPEMAQEGFRAIRNLGHLHDDNLLLLAEAGACDVVMKAIKLYAQSPAAGSSGTLQWGWFAVASLSDRKENLQLFGAAGACQELVRTITRFGSSSPDVAQWVCMALSKLARDADISKYIGYEGACRGVAHLLATHTASPEVVEECFAAIASLCSHDDCKNRDILSECGVADVFIKAMSKHEREEEVGEQACWALSCLLIDALRPSGAALVAKFVAAGVCKVLPKVLGKHSANYKVCEYGCHSVVLLTSLSNASYLSKLGAAGMAAAIVTSLQIHCANASIARWALMAIKNLCSDEGNLSKLRVAGAAAAVSRTLQVHHSRSEELSRLSLLSLVALAADDVCRSKLGSLEGCAEAVIASLYAHSDSDVLAICACDIMTEMCRPPSISSGSASGVGSSSGAAASVGGALAAAANFSDQSSSSPPPVERLGSIGAALAIVSVLEKHKVNVAVVSAACKSIDALCSGDNGEANRARFPQAGVVSILMQVLHSLSLEGSPQSTDTTSSICSAIAGMLCPGASQAENQNSFASLGAAAELKALLVRCADNAVVSQSCCRALSLFASGNQATQHKLLECGATEVIASLCKRYMDNDAVIVQVALSVAEFSFDNSPNSTTFGRLGICKDLVSVLLRHRKNEAVCEACCRAIFSLKDQNILLGAAGACEAVLPILAQHPGSEAVAQWVCRAIGSLAENQNNKKILGASSACEVVTAALQRHVANDSLLSVVLMRSTSSAGVAQWGCAAMYFLARGQGKLEEEYRRKLVSAGACEAVAKALVKYSEVETVAQNCCRAVVVLVEGKDREAHAARLGSLGVCATVVDSLHLFPSSIPVAKWGCRAVAVLAEGCEANVVRLVAAGCCEVIPVAMQAHQTSEAVAGAGSDALTSISANVKSGYAARLGHTGACESVVSVLRRHRDNADVVERGCRAMANLALVKGNSSWFGPAGACDALLKVQQAHPDNENLAAAAWLAAGSLCVDNNNKHRLGQGGACEQIVESMRILLKYPSVAKAAGNAIGKLCEVSHLSSRSPQDMPEITFSAPTNTSSNPTQQHHHDGKESQQQSHAEGSGAGLGRRENRERLFKSGCCDVIIEALKLHVGEVGVALSLCRTVGILAKGIHSSAEREQFGVVGGCEAVVQAMQRFQNTEGVARCGCLAIRALAFDHSNNQKALRVAGGCEVVVDAMRRHSLTQSGPLVHEAATWAASNLAQGSAENKELLGTLGAVEAVLEAFELHGRYLEVTRWSCSALRHLCDGNERNRSKISFSCAPELLCMAIQKFVTEDEIVEWALLTMVVVCADRVGQHRLGLVGICKAVIPILQRSDVLASLACNLIAALSIKSPDNQTKLGQAGACKAVLQTLEAVMLRSEHTSGSINRKTNHYTVLDTVKDIAVSVFASASAAAASASTSSSSTSDEAAPASTAGVAAEDQGQEQGQGQGQEQQQQGQKPVDERETTTAVAVLVEGCLRALNGLALGHEGNRSKLMSLGAVDLVSAVLNLNFFSEELKEEAREALESIENVVVPR